MVMRFSWRALILAPIVVPLVYCALFVAVGGGGPMPVGSFLLFFLPAVVLSYGVTVLAFLPVLFILSKFSRPTAILACVTGAALGFIAWLPVSFFMWKSSGPDSGPPITPWLEDFLYDLGDPLIWSFPVAGLVTASIFWVLARHPAAVHGSIGGGVAAHFWTAVILAPPIFPLAFAALLTIILHPAASPVIVFAQTAISAIVFSYAVTVLLFLPALWLLSKVIRLQAPIVCLAGAAVGAACHQLIVLRRPAADNAHTARPDLFIPFLPQAWVEQLIWVFPLAGFITAALFWLVAYGVRRYPPAETSPVAPRDP